MTIACYCSLVNDVFTLTFLLPFCVLLTFFKAMDIDPQSRTLLVNDNYALAAFSTNPNLFKLIEGKDNLKEVDDDFKCRFMYEYIKGVNEILSIGTLVSFASEMGV